MCSWCMAFTVAETNQLQINARRTKRMQKAFSVVSRVNRRGAASVSLTLWRENIKKRWTQNFLFFFKLHVDIITHIIAFLYSVAFLLSQRCQNIQSDVPPLDATHVNNNMSLFLLGFPALFSKSWIMIFHRQREHSVLITGIPPSFEIKGAGASFGWITAEPLPAALKRWIFSLSFLVCVTSESTFFAANTQLGRWLLIEVLKVDR